MAEQQHEQRTYVTGPDRPLTREDALAMGYALFDKIAADQARRARAEDPERE